MNIAPDSKTTRTPSYPALVFLALVIAGLAGNYFKFELFFNIQFIFGSVFALLALQILGLVPGVLAAILISSITYSLWNHPYAIIIMSAEVLTVGWLHLHQRRLGMVLACALYWFCLGMPLVYLFYHGFMHMPLNSALITMVKQAINGIANALVARLLFMVVGIAVKRTTFSFREIIFHLLTLFVLGPSLFILTMESKTEFAETDQGVRESLLHSSSRTAHNLEHWLLGHLTLISHLASMATTSDVSSLQRGVEEVHTGSQDFLRVGLLDRAATIIAFSPLTDEFGQPNIGRNFADRPFISTLKQTLKPMLSEVVMGRINRPEPVVSMLAPVVNKGVYDGYAIGVLNLTGLFDIIESETAHQGMSYTLLDKNGKVIISNREDVKIMEAFVRQDGDLRQMGNGISQWVPPSKRNISISERWRKSSYIKETTIGSMSEWRLILEQPVAPFQARLYKRYSGKLGLLLIVLALALALAEVISRNLIVSLERLEALSTNLPQKLLSANEIVWPQSAIMETDNLLTNFRGMATALSDKFHEIKELNKNLENRIQQRSHEALQLANRYQTLMMTATDGIHVVDEQGNVVEANDAFCQLLGYTPEEMLRLNVKDWEAQLPPEEIQAQISRLIRQPALYTSRDRRKDGEIIDVEISAGGGLIDGRPYLFKASRDITARKQSEEMLLRSLKEKEVMLKEIHHRVKNNMQVVYSLLNLQAKTIVNPVIRALFEESRNRVSSMALIHEKLYRSEDLASIDFKDYLQGLIAGIAETYNRRDVEFVVKMPSLTLDVNTGIPCGLIVNELASNSLKHAFPDGRPGRVTLGIDKDSEGQNVLTFADNGIGFPTELDIKSTNTLGMQLITVLTEQLQGNLEMQRDEGTKFIITFPGG